MARTFADLRTEALHDEFDPTKYGGYALTYLAEAVRRVARFVRLPGASSAHPFATTAGTPTYSLPSGLVRIDYLRNATDRQRLVPIELRDFDEAAAASGKPTAFAVAGQNVYLWPTPDAAYQMELRYLVEPPEPTDTQTPGDIGFPDDYASMLVDYAKARLFRMEDDPEMAEIHMAQFDRQLQFLKADVQARVRVPRQIPGTVDGDYDPYAFGLGGFRRP